ncbi:hypothetical protein [Rhizobium phaseoli]|uniref:hypothetical protein n=1 Tax=Rhizobium phaseoli TaxID=396 RepID=UPI0007EAC9B8|nr:hypothetical protein [Rhizobium phaseoli]ANL33939.1 hypothetical protein AMC89_CH01866 [Rhizobium phaseoli]ANL97664.1 hypothetical protein AMC79_CH01861 [Rhizobium phaseoli]
MHLFHFTSAAHLRGISQHGITVGDVVTSFEKFEGRIAVWLTSSPDPAGHGLRGGRADKTEFRLTVDIPDDAPDLHKWTEWAPANLTPDTRLRLESVNGWAFSSWYLLFGNVRPHSIGGVVSMKTGMPVANWGEYYSEELSVPGVSYAGRHAWHNRLLRDVRRASRAAG